MTEFCVIGIFVTVNSTPIHCCKVTTTPKFRQQKFQTRRQLTLSSPENNAEVFSTIVDIVTFYCDINITFCCTLRNEAMCFCSPPILHRKYLKPILSTA